MAVTKMHPIRRTVGKAVDYITDNDKTDGEIYVSTYGCTRETVEDDFDYTKHKTSYNGAILAQHVIQSFAEGEIIRSFLIIISPSLFQSAIPSRPE
jgi:hypothetical protein